MRVRLGTSGRKLVGVVHLTHRACLVPSAARVAEELVAGESAVEVTSISARHRFFLADSFVVTAGRKR